MIPFFNGGVLALTTAGGVGDLLGGDSMFSSSLWFIPGGIGSLVIEPLCFLPVSFLGSGAVAGGSGGCTLSTELASFGGSELGSGGVGGCSGLSFGNGTVSGKAISFSLTTFWSDGIGMSSMSIGMGMLALFFVLAVASTSSLVVADVVVVVVVVVGAVLGSVFFSVSVSGLCSALFSSMFSSFFSSSSRLCRSFTSSANRLVSVILFFSWEDLIE